MTRALFLSCSRAKIPQAGLMPAVERYDGPAFRTLRRWRQRAGDLRVWVLSAEHGLISGDAKIADYDRYITRDRIPELREDTEAKLKSIAESHSFSSALICMTDAYTPAFPDHFPGGVKTEKAGGKIGGKISHLKAWLGGDDIPSFAGEISSEEHEARICGKSVRASAEQGISLAREGLARGDPAAANWQTWYVPVDDRKQVAVKWLVAELTGLSVSQFRTADALRVLRFWGIPYQNRIRK